MKNISKEELKEILKKHKMWLKGEKGGKCADLSNTNLSNANLWNANLIYVNLNGANLSNAGLWNANLTSADLSNANLTYADLSNANLNHANLTSANLSDADLSNANLNHANLSDANLINADLRGTNLWDADLSDANLKNIKTSTSTIGYNLACPEEGSFIGYKKADGCIIKLLILEDAKRSSATTFKCRCDKAKVLEIRDIDTGESMEKTRSNYNPNFIYKVGEIVTVEDFDDDRWNECAPGIHFFMNKENALNYQ